MTIPCQKNKVLTSTIISIPNNKKSIINDNKFRYVKDINKNIKLNAGDIIPKGTILASSTQLTNK